MPFCESQHWYMTFSELLRTAFNMMDHAGSIESMRIVCMTLTFLLELFQHEPHPKCCIFGCVLIQGSFRIHPKHTFSRTLSSAAGCSLPQLVSFLLTENHTYSIAVVTPGGSGVDSMPFDSPSGHHGLFPRSPTKAGIRGGGPVLKKSQGALKKSLATG